MQAWLAELLISILTKLTSWLVARGLEAFNAKKKQIDTDAGIDARLASVKSAYQEAFNGEKVTPEQRTALQRAIHDFIRSGDGSGPGL